MKKKHKAPTWFTKLRIDRSALGTIGLEDEGFDAEYWSRQSKAKRFEHLLILGYMNYGQAALDPGLKGPLEIVDQEPRQVSHRRRVGRQSVRLRKNDR